MTEAAARDGFERFVEDAVETTAAEFSVARALRQGTRGPGGAVADRLLKNSDALRRRVVEPELDVYRRRTLEQFDVLLEFVADDADIDAYRDRLLAVDSYAAALRSDLPEDRHCRVCDAVVERHRRLGDAVEPLVASEESTFWAALDDAYDRGTATDLVAEHFAFTGPLREHRDAFAMTVTIDPGDVLGGLAGALGGLPTVEVDYTDESIRAMCRAERRVIAETTREIERRL